MGEIFGTEQASTTALQVVPALEASAPVPAYYTICSILTTFLLLLVIKNITRALPTFPQRQPIGAPAPTTPATSIVPSLSIPATKCESLRGAARANSSQTTSGQSPKSPRDSHAQAVAQANSASASGSGKKKAALIGLNYSRYRKDSKEVRPLKHAARDARRFADSLMKLGYSSEDMRVVTDEDGQPFPSHAYLVECMDWLVRDVSEGDRLFFLFSGHCEPSKLGTPEPYTSNPPSPSPPL